MKKFLLRSFLAGIPMLLSFILLLISGRVRYLFENSSMERISSWIILFLLLALPAASIFLFSKFSLKEKGFVRILFALAAQAIALFLSAFIVGGIAWACGFN